MAGPNSRREVRGMVDFSLWLPPAVPEASVVLDLLEGGVAGAERVADALDSPIGRSPASHQPRIQR